MDARALSGPPMAPPPSPRAPAPALRLPPHLPDEIVEHILLRIPPHDNARLLRAAIACKRWARLFADRGFRRRYRERHRRAAPVLGLLANMADTSGVARFFPACGFRPPHGACDGYRAHDARHGRVLLNRVPGTLAPAGHATAFAVWDPTTGEHHQIPHLPRPRPVTNWNAAVLCGAPGPCDHLHCQGGPFRVVFVAMHGTEVFAHVYSSASGAWCAGNSALLPGPEDTLDAALPGGVLAGGCLHFVLLQGTRIIRCDPATVELAVLRLPVRPAYDPRIALTTTEDGGLGYAEVSPETGVLRVWSWKVQEGDAQGVGGRWVPTRTFDLIDELPPEAVSIRGPPNVVAYADGPDVIFLKSADNHGLYSMDLDLGEVTKVPVIGGFGFYDLIPYVGFYLPVIRAALTASGEGSSVGASTSA